MDLAEDLHGANRCLTGRKIILAVGCKEKRKHLYLTLAGAGSSIIEVSNGLEVLSSFDKHKPDLVVIDEDLPVINGKTVARVISNCNKSRDCPVLFTSSGNDLMTVASEGKRIFENIDDLWEILAEREKDENKR